MQTTDLERALETARKAAQAGAKIAMNKRAGRERLVVEAKEITDYVTDVDRSAQTAMIAIIREKYPDHRILAEEDGAEGLGDPSSPFLWIIDPLDGTKPYVHGKDEFACIIALAEAGTTILGVMEAPAKKDSFWGTSGGGAYLNGKAITSLRATRDLDDAILCTNMGGKSRGTDKVITIRHPRCASLQNYGCAAVEMAEILKGGNDGVFFEGVHLWDVAPACLLIEEAGGKTRTELMDPKKPRGGVRCVASTQPIFGELCRFVFR
ncbi:MAG: inositol monophosphatase [Candidatus Peribacteraceae bacterium]|nr:inositol monophosphatase [Candidatus Peribacteraceae bacterium]